MKPWKCWTPCENLDNHEGRKFTFIIYDENKMEIDRKIVQAYEAWKLMSMKPWKCWTP